GFGDRLEPAEPLGDVGDEARLAHLAVSDHVQAVHRLGADGVGHRVAHALDVRIAVIWSAVGACLYQLEKVARPRQAPGVRSEDPGGAPLHRGSPSGTKIDTRGSGPTSRVPCP